MERESTEAEAGPVQAGPEVPGVGPVQPEAGPVQVLVDTVEVQQVPEAVLVLVDTAEVLEVLEVQEVPEVPEALGGIIPGIARLQAGAR